MGVFRVEQASVEPGFVAEKKKSLRIRIKSTKRINIFRESKLSQGSVGGAIQGELGNHPIGFVKSEEHNKGDSIDFISGVRPKKRPPIRVTIVPAIS